MPSGHVDKTKPLRPLSEHAIEALTWLRYGPQQRYLFNAGVSDRLLRGELAEPTQVGGKAGFRITETGISTLRLLGR